MELLLVVSISCRNWDKFLPDGPLGTHAGFSLHTIKHFVPIDELLTKMLHRMPLMEKAEIRHLTNGPESFTPDSRYLLGEVPEVGLVIFTQASVCKQ